ncbi:CAP domain-containing protein [Microvirga sp. P5_D2]
MSQATAFEQLMLELVNAARAKTGAQPLAFNGNLNNSADAHSQWMIDTDAFSHTGVSASAPTQRMESAGYAFTGSWTSGENIAWASTRAPNGLQDEVRLLHTNLMNSPGHKANILNGDFREIGIGFKVGPYQGWEGAFATQNFARSGSNVFLTGVTMDDKDGDRAYDIGEALSGLTITAISSTGARFTTKSEAAGGYSLALDPGSYRVTYSKSGYASVTKQVSIGEKNVKLDLIDPAKAAPAKVIIGDGLGNSLDGTAGTDRINGRAGHDKIHAKGGNDYLIGDTGNDWLYGESGRDTLLGGSGNDVLTGGSHADTFCFRGKWGSDKVRDFQDGIDFIDLRGNGLSFDMLSITTGNGDTDRIADDVIIKANGQTIALLNMKAALINASDFLF